MKLDDLVEVVVMRPAVEEIRVATILERVAVVRYHAPDELDIYISDNHMLCRVATWIGKEEDAELFERAPAMFWSKFSNSIDRFFLGQLARLSG